MMTMMLLSAKLTERTPSSRLFGLLMVGLAVVMALSIGFAGKAEAKEKVVDKDPDGNQVASGELLVTYKRDASERARDEAPKKVGGQLEQDFSEIKVQHLSLPEVKNERDPQVRQKALEQKKRDLERDPAVEAVDYNYRREAGWVPNDPHYGLQWGYPKIRAPQAWDITQGSSTVKVAVLDGGIDNNHADLQGKVVRQYDFGNGDTDASPNANDNGHGTHVAGTVAASTNNGKGVAGSCPNCSLLFAKVFDSNGQVYDSYVVPALNWSANNGARVINMSFGGPGYSSALETAINNAWNKQAVLVASAMNNGTSGTKYYPAAYDNVMAVAATDKNDQKYYWSNSGDWVDVAAPGVDIYSTTLSEWVVVQDFSGVKSWKLVPRYAYSTGTSMAAPHVSGLAGLILSKNAGLTNKEVRYRIERTAVDLVSAGWSGKDPIIGSGRIDACAALGSCRLSVKG